MARIQDEAEHQRRERIYLTIRSHRHGISEDEISKLLNLGRRTVNNYLNKLDAEGKIFKDGVFWCPLEHEETRLSRLELEAEEALTLVLATRLLVKQHDRRNEPAETALVKLAEALQGSARVGTEIAQAAQELAQRPPAANNYGDIYRTMMRAYIYRRKVKMRYHPLKGRPFETTFDPYLFEPSPIGLSIYAIGYSAISDALRSYKLERIESAQLTRHEYRTPADFPGLEILRHSWSVIIGEDVVHVVLRFTPRVRKRVLETRWHPSQQTSDDPEQPHFLRWEVDVADTLDMTPWIRGWGRDVEVLAPQELRETFMGETRLQAMQYGWHVSRHPHEAPSILDDFFGT